MLVSGGTRIGLSDPDDIATGDLYAEDGRIAAVGREAARRAAAAGEPVTVLDARGKWVLPGFVGAHLHLCQTLLRNGPEDLELLPWLEGYVWPGEAALDAETMSVAARLGLSECLASGVTAVLDMGTVRHSDVLFETAARAGIRYTGGNVLMDDPATAPRALREEAAAGLAETRRLAAKWNGREAGRLRVAVQPRFAVTCTDGLLREAGALARAQDLTIHTHASESLAEVELVRRRTGRDNVAYLEAVGLLSPAACVAHAVHTGISEWRLLARAGATVVHCPSSNAKLRSGICPVAPMRAAGVRVALGSDGAACNDRLDPFAEIRLAAALPALRGVSERLSAFDVVRMATRDGARALRLPGGDELTVEGRADFTVLDPEAGWALPEAPVGPPYAAIVHAMGRENVFATIVDGVVRYRRDDPSVGGLKPEPAEVRDAARRLRARMAADAAREH